MSPKNMDEHKVIRVGITGQSGFIGGHLYNFLGLKKNILRIPFSDHFFNDSCKLNNFVNQCDIIIHLAGMNRHSDESVIYNTNIELVHKLIASCNNTNSKATIFFCSSIQETLDNLYGKSKRDGRILLENWAKTTKRHITTLIIPNVFGPFCKPNYNSVIATFCYLLTHGGNPELLEDKSLELIYINELIEEIYNLIIGEKYSYGINNYHLPKNIKIKVSEILLILQNYKELYFNEGIIPHLGSSFKLALFNTFRCYINSSKYPFRLKQNIDSRGSFIEVIKTNTVGQLSYSTTKPGITRGNHFHLRKIERFMVVKGEAIVNLRRIGSDEILSFALNSNNPSFIDIPIWYSHNLSNNGKDELVTLFWTNEFYDPENSDTYYEDVNPQKK